MNFKDKFHNIKECAVNSVIYRGYYNPKIRNNIIYVESRNGTDFAGNIFRIIEEISTGEYGKFRIYVHANKNVKLKIEQLSENYDLNIHRIITNDDYAAWIMHKAKYIFTDSGLNYKYVKKKGQIVINTWHGTPLKLMGYRNIPEQPNLGIIQHSLLSSDYLIFPNVYMKDLMLDAYMIGKIYSGEMLLEGYPRNSIFFDEKRRDELKGILSLEDKEIFVYMPTFKGSVNNRDDEKQNAEISGFLDEIEDSLSENQIFFVKLHPYNQAKIDFSNYNHIMPFPEGWEIYDLLNMADCLITDYSSVFFDFANTKRKIIIFNYDEEEYMKERGTYFPLDELPFPKVQTVSELIYEMNVEKDYDDSEFIETYCTYDCPDAANRICRHIFKGDDICISESVERDKNNILIYSGSLEDNIITDNLIKMLENSPLQKYNYFITFKGWDGYVRENHEKIFNKFPDEVDFLPFNFYFTPTLGEKLRLDKFLAGGDDFEAPKPLKDLFKRTYVRHFGNIKIKALMDFGVYDHDMSEILKNSEDNYIPVKPTQIPEIKNNVEEYDEFSEDLCYFDFITFRNGILNISGYFNSFDSDLQVIGKEGENVFHPDVYDYPTRRGKTIYNFDFKIPITDKDIRFEVNASNDVDYPVQFRKYCNISNFSRYFIKDGKIIYFDGAINVENFSYLRMLRLEFADLSNIIGSGEAYFIHAVIFRLLHLILYPFMKNREIWIVMDRKTQADDNAEHFFRYAVNQDDDVKKYFAVHNSSNDFRRLKNVFANSLLVSDSMKHRFYYMFASKLISSQGTEYDLTPFAYKNYKLMAGIINLDFYFLQHGIIKDNMSSWLRKYDRNPKLIVTSTDLEYESLFNNEGYYYNRDVVQLLGLPRYDNLDNKYLRRQIIIMPTWRNYLTNSFDFIQSDFYKYFNSLINNPRLIQAAANEGYKIILKLHPELNRYIELFDKNPYVEFDLSKTYAELINESSLMITDYSSVFFDFGYLKKPLIHYQYGNDYHFDSENGYFQYKTMGFGPVFDDEDDVIDKVIEYMENHCEMEDMYKERVDEFFKYHDKNNSKRCYDWIIRN
ncbi:CDP-glycerol glycerophosphotransferase family protein [Methanobrevibacter sp.]